MAMIAVASGDMRIAFSLAISLGLSHNFRDDHEQLRHGFVVYDALYSWSRHVRGETHTWNPQRAA